MAIVDEHLRFSRIATNGIQLHVAEAGPPAGPLVFLLHGFPEYWFAWRNQIASLAERGFHVVAPDQRGYNLSDKPKGVDAYDLDQLAADVLGLADHFGQETFAVAGHDWGATVGWWLASGSSRRLRQLVAMNAPHPAVWLEAMRADPVQRQKSSYVQLFRVPWFPELLIGLNRSKALSKGFKDSARTDAFTAADLEQYRNAWFQPGTLTATINYYRALLRKRLLPASQYRVRCPTLVIWGKRDGYAIPELAEASARMCATPRIVYFDGASHWVQHDMPDEVSGLLAEFLAQGSVK
jgi:pimeloyl-ACP methyl ester carboxylesterase